MSARHPILAITGASGAGTTSILWTFQQIFRREGVAAAIVEGDAFARYTADDMQQRLAQTPDTQFSQFGPEANLFAELETLLRTYGRTGAGRVRRTVQDAAEARALNQAIGSFTAWEDLPDGTDLLFYEGLHGGLRMRGIDIAGQVDLLIGVAPSINLEWIQKLHHDQALRGHSQEAIIDTILRRMPDYVRYICPQFSNTHVNFQRVPTVDTSNPFAARDVPSNDESMLVIRFRDPKGIDFPYLLSMLDGAFMSRANTIVCQGGKMALAMQLIFTPMIWQLMERRGRNA